MIRNRRKTNTNNFGNGGCVTWDNAIFFRASLIEIWDAIKHKIRHVKTCIVEGIAFPIKISLGL